MTKRKTLLLLSTAFCLLASCASQGGAATNSSIETSQASFGALSVEAKAKAFYQYDAISYEDFAVKGSSGEKVSGFSIWLGEEELVDKESRLLKVGTLTLLFKAEGYSSFSYSIDVKRSTNFSQSLSLSSLPKKTSYQNGESFSSDGLKLSLSLSYTRQSNENVEESIPLEDYSITIEGKEAEGYVFKGEGHALKYALIEGKDIQGKSLYYSLPLSLEAASREETNPAIADEEEKYAWTSDASKMSVSFSNPSQSKGKAYYSPEEINLDFNLNSYCNKDCASFRQTPSLGEVPLLVVPVVLNGQEENATEENHKLIEKAFFGKSEENDKSPECSLASYYYYSSFKQLRFTGKVTSYFNPVKEGYKGYAHPYSFNTSTPASLAKDALDWASKTQGISLDDYDSDDDGYVDGIWLIYVEGGSSNLTGNFSAFWPFTSTAALNPGSKENPSANTFAWAGTAHLYGSLALSSYVKKQGVDAHVLMHETGHMLGLNDYYSYQSVSTGEGYYSPLGFMDMMDKDYGDHDPYSKLLLGWIKPYLILDDCEISIPSNQVQNSLFLLPYDGKTYQKDGLGRIILNPFDEYLLLDYYTYENLFKETYEADSSSYSFPTVSGARLYHIDARVVRYEKGSFILPEDPDEVLTSNSSYYRLITNSQAGERAEGSYGVKGLESYFDEIRVIPEDNVKISGLNSPSESALFKVGDEFNIESYSSQFYQGEFDNKKTFSTSFKIVSIG